MNAGYDCSLKDQLFGTLQQLVRWSLKAMSMRKATGCIVKVVCCRSDNDARLRAQLIEVRRSERFGGERTRLRSSRICLSFPQHPL